MPESAVPPSSVLILYATVTGTAEDVAQTLRERLLHVGVRVRGALPLAGYGVADLQRDAAGGCAHVFVVATAGDGEAPPAMLPFWTALRRASLPRDALRRVRAAVFGLGDRAYPKFNAAARRLAIRIADLGATSLLPLALGDDSAHGSYEEALRPWAADLMRLCAPQCSEDVLNAPLPPPVAAFSVKEVAGGALSGGDWRDVSKWKPGQAQRKLRLPGLESVHVLEAKVLSNVVLTNPEELREEREVREISLDMCCDGVEYVPGDVVCVLARNRLSAVNAFLELMSFDGTTTIDLFPRESAAGVGTNSLESFGISTPCLLSDFVAAQLDLSATPRRRFLERLAHFARDPLQREKLQELSSPAGADDYAQYAQRECRTILMVLRDFPSARPPLEDILDMIPPLRPRAFSLASSCEAHGRVLKICAAMVKYKTPLRFVRTGVCSSFWLSAEVGDVVPVYLQKGTLRFQPQKPAILVGPGTGVAPMRSFVSSLCAQVDGGCDGSAKTRILYFGCRHERGDYLYKDEWATAVLEGRLQRVETAFSRDGSSRKVYVQDKMEENGKELWQVLGGSAQGVLYLAGAAGNMPKGVRLSVVKAAEQFGCMSSRDAEAFVKKLERQRRLQMECW